MVQRQLLVFVNSKLEHNKNPRQLRDHNGERPARFRQDTLLGAGFSLFGRYLKTVAPKRKR
jgi:hypothetical protein